jgi:adenosine 3'-phospho 5'-phosphosulfate transporter B3
MTSMFILTGDIQETISFVYLNSSMLWLLTVFTFLAYISITFHMMLVKEFGGITTVLIGNMRKALTIVFSFIIFPKPVSYLYVIGGVLVFGSLIGNTYMKEKVGSGHSSNIRKAET